ncbi:membrane protein insertase, YidC/Oxa1 family, C-terminal domain protein [Desulfosporosinus orientis DSM 765]|uniref:Membrane protein insertase, YidC/Oxa1 family, C-terminal domain protein n=1 Tax=Desulfosporosinus orientis (strain ATCC 19365 / DSM 765 / NCIMB 8382 / VKM B-1628 / Singapore I) TaxID=768706 RepID=G7WHQ3_DESOD|nr:membrane protein insertase YidC [Desulfosporosinus orientis]AET69615.1 membrane protein insertase, YidC/Oxa1 family, C-terminal domain protein [Desulfosporosinus orientis DSM 765]
MHMFSSTFSLILSSLINFTGDWFFAIALLTIGIKICLFPFSLRQQRSQLLTANFNEAKSIITKKFKNKKDKANSEIIKVASKYRVNSLTTFIPLLLQAPIFFSLYFSVLNLSSTVGSSVLPWISGVHSIDNLHVLPLLAGLSQGLSGFTMNSKNLSAFIVPVIIGVVFLWKAPAALSAYWLVNSASRFLEMKIFSLDIMRRKFFNVPTADQMAEKTA